MAIRILRRLASVFIATVLALTTLGSFQRAEAAVAHVEVRGNLVTVFGQGRAASRVVVNRQVIPVVGSSTGGWSATVPMPAGRYSVNVTAPGGSLAQMIRVTAMATNSVKSTYGKAVLRKETDPDPIDPADPTMEVIDIPKTIARLKAMGVNEYMYLIYNWRPRYSVGTDERIRSANRWETLPAFATAARAAGINVKVYLVPPTGTDQIPYLPFGHDYRRWMVEIAALAKKHPNIRGLAMDDMRDLHKVSPGQGAPAANPARLKAWMAEARRQAPWLTFQTVYYGYDILSGNKAAMPAWRDAIDGIIFPYRGSEDHRGLPPNTTNHDDTITTTDQASAAVNCPRTDLTCLQVDIPASVPTSAGAWATADVKVGADRRVSVWASSAVPGAARPHGAIVRLRVGNIDLGTAALRDGRQRYEFYAPPQLAGKTVRVTFEVRRLVKQRGTWMINVPTGSSGTAGGPYLHSGPLAGSAAVSRPVKPISFVPMVYAMRLYAERDNPAAASPAYVDKVMTGFNFLRVRGLAAGAVGYCVNIAGINDGIRYGGDPATYAVMAKHYAAWR